MALFLFIFSTRCSLFNATSCSMYYVFQSKTKSCQHQTHVILLQLWPERGQFARSNADVARTRAVCPRQRFSRMDKIINARSANYTQLLYLEKAVWSIRTHGTECTAAVCVATTDFGRLGIQRWPAWHGIHLKLQYTMADQAMNL